MDSCHAGGTSETALNLSPEKMSAKTVTAGVWGAQHMRVEVSAAGARLEWDCAHGSVEKPLTADQQGLFAVEGIYVRERPGPIRVGVEQPTLRASYAGLVSGSSMTLTVTLIESKETVGTFLLSLGDEGRLRKCR